MKYLFKILFVLLVLSDAWAQTAIVPDITFRNFLKNKYPWVIDSKGNLIIQEAAAVTGTLDVTGKNINSLEGVQYFTKIASLYAADNSLTFVPDLSGISNLKTIHLESNQLTALPGLQNLNKLQTLIFHTNRISSLPDFSSNTILEEIIGYNNFITSVPDLSSLANLYKIDLGNNRITSIPSFAGNSNLQIISLDRNFLETTPDVNGLTNLTKVQLHLNYLSFEDLMPLTTIPSFSTIFQVSPQRNFPRSSIIVKEGNKLNLSTGLDKSLSPITYEWYFNGQLVQSVSNDTVVINNFGIQNEGYYYCKWTYTGLPSVTLNTDSFFVIMDYCPDLSSITYTSTPVTCMNKGSIKLDISGILKPGNNFYLKSVTGKTYTSQDGNFKELLETDYTLTVESSTGCKVNFAQPLHINLEDCRETYITPNNDGDSDNINLSYAGSAVIYDKAGGIIKKMFTPLDWDGTNNSGKLVPPGYYFIDINNGQEIIRVSVIY